MNVGNILNILEEFSMGFGYILMYFYDEVVFGCRGVIFMFVFFGWFFISGVMGDV